MFHYQHGTYPNQSGRTSRTTDWMLPASDYLHVIPIVPNFTLVNSLHTRARGSRYEYCHYPELLSFRI